VWQRVPVATAQPASLSEPVMLSYYPAGYYPDGTVICEISPIIINLRNDKLDLRLTSAVDGVPFDLDGDGALEQVSWTAPGSAVAFLVLDRNGNGIIDDGSELFGTATRKRDGPLRPTALPRSRISMADQESATGRSTRAIRSTHSCGCGWTTTTTATQSQTNCSRWRVRA
jgi:hypothetical protein